MIGNKRESNSKYQLQDKKKNDWKTKEQKSNNQCVLLKLSRELCNGHQHLLQPRKGLATFTKVKQKGKNYNKVVACAYNATK